MNITSLLIISGLILCFSCTNQSAVDLKDPVSTIDPIQPQMTVEKSLVDEKYESEDFAKIGFELLNKESFGYIKIGLSSSRAIELLGKPDEKSEFEYWGADGLNHQNWFYRNLGIELNLSAEKKENQTINSIYISEPCSFFTKRHIGIGSSIDEVKNAYRKAIDTTFSDSNSIVAGSIYGGIIFKFKDKKVETIFIGAIAE